MKNKRLRNYLQQKAKKNELIQKENQGKNPAKHTNQDFTGYPHAPAKKEIINPKTTEEKKIAAVDVKDGEKIIDPKEKKKNNPSARENDEQESNGSANAFDATERVQD